MKGANKWINRDLGTEESSVKEKRSILVQLGQVNPPLQDLRSRQRSTSPHSSNQTPPRGNLTPLEGPLTTPKGQGILWHPKLHFAPKRCGPGASCSGLFSGRLMRESLVMGKFHRRRVSEVLSLPGFMLVLRYQQSAQGKHRFPSPALAPVGLCHTGHWCLLGVQQMLIITSRWLDAAGASAVPGHLISILHSPGVAHACFSSVASSRPSDWTCSDFFAQPARSDVITNRSSGRGFTKTWRTNPEWKPQRCFGGGVDRGAAADNLI
ncbi:hypothetical protein K402DRAFT_243106 [Aulographum hederae CBS 113979]|uniref:Uncharacterized protein n=1 Tax=Aulographum hederae CBS 113979 TaxID=1176131 RepID=A0A6G1H9K9_9PEZI|nr:hypothetical protein K402DRAFT_243106 [Aulographum hederae CBS 113979]